MLIFKLRIIYTNDVALISELKLHVIVSHAFNSKSVLDQKI